MATQTSRRALLKGVGSAGAGATALTAIQQPAAARERPGRRPRKPNVIVRLHRRPRPGRARLLRQHVQRDPDASTRWPARACASPRRTPRRRSARQPRAALVTGLYPARTGVTDFLRGEPAA